MVLPTPLYHCLGSVGGTMVSMTHGITLILPSPSFDGKKALEAISRERWASVGSHPWATETLLFLTHGPSSLPKISSLQPGEMETWKWRNGDRGSGGPPGEDQFLLPKSFSCLLPPSCSLGPDSGSGWDGGEERVPFHL